MFSKHMRFHCLNSSLCYKGKKAQVAEEKPDPGPKGPQLADIDFSVPSSSVRKKPPHQLHGRTPKEHKSPKVSSLLGILTTRPARHVCFLDIYQGCWAA